MLRMGKALVTSHIHIQLTLEVALQEVRSEQHNASQPVC